MATAADRYTDKTFGQLESRISRMYKEAQKDLRQKLADFTRHHKAKDAEMQRKLKAGEITQAQYQQWIMGQVFVGNQWKQKIEQINDSIKGVMQSASDITHGQSMNVFAENANYTAYQLEKDLGASINFGLYDTSTVSRLVGKDPEILPRRVVNGKKLDAWETKKISNAISQGIIQGEGIDQIADRIARDTCIAADHSSVMYARTAMTAAQNSGRIERLHEAEEMGIRVQKRWMATLDDRTRDSHRDMDGETVDVDDKFSNGLMYPGDPATNDFAEICNCRCTMVYVYPEFTQSFERSASLGYDEEGHHQYETVKDMTYREWEKSKKGHTTVEEEPAKPTKPARTNSRFLTFDTEEDNKRLESQREENERLKKEYKQLDEEYWKSYEDIDKINAEITELEKLEKLYNEDYSYFDQFSSKEELKQRRNWISDKIDELYDKEEKLIRPRREDFANEDDYWAARMKWTEDRNAITNERADLEKELYKAYNTPGGDWKGVEQWRKARDIGEEGLTRQREELLRRKEQLKQRRTEITSKQGEISNKLSTTNEASLVDQANTKGVQFLAPERLTEQPSLDNIVKRLGGGDETEGSCASLGFCYIGQKNGVDVLDFRDGASRELFSLEARDILRGISAETGKPLLEASTKTGTGGAIRLLGKVESGKEYYFVTGRHAAIVRRIGNDIEYMELQSHYHNGWTYLGTDDSTFNKKFLDNALRHRFGCSSHISGEALMMDINDMKNSKLLQRSWGYMNTAESAQHKGALGHER